jgi:hypothetical protein
MPESITASLTPAPVEPSCHALIALDEIAPFER